MATVPARLPYALLLPGLLIFGVRALMTVFHVDPGTVPGLGPVTALTGALSLVGLAALVGLHWHGQRNWAIASATVALVGHYVLGLLYVPLGPAATYAGIAMAFHLRDERAALLVAIAAAGAAIRPWGELAVAAGTLAGFAVMLWSIVRTGDDGETGVTTTRA